MKASTFTTFVVAAITYTTFIVPDTAAKPKACNNSCDYFKQQITQESSSAASEVRYESEQQNYLYVNSELYDLINSKQECYSSNKNFTYHYLYFCSTIGYLQNVDKRYKGKEYVNIHYKTMTEIVSKYIYSLMINNLKKWGVIGENKSYQVDRYSKSYKLKPPYNTNLKRVPIKDKLIIRKLNQFKMKYQKEIEKLPFPYQYLSMTNSWIKMDVANAMWFNELNYFTEKAETYNANLYSIYAYDDEWYRFSVDTTGNRVHTNLSNLSTEFRQFLSVDDEPLGQVDISNSQPMFFYLYIKNLTSIPQIEKDNYREIVESGKFYEYFMGKLNISSDKRQIVKKRILAAVFFDRYRRNESRYVKVFKQDFPNIAAYITKLRKRDHRTLAKILQRTESKFVIESVVAKFIQYFGEANEFIATIHDSIVVKTHMLDAAKEIMGNCFLKEGINPKLKMDFF